MWILIIILTVSNSNSSPAIKDIEFKTQEACETARKEITTGNRASTVFVGTVCVRK